MEVCSLASTGDALGGAGDKGLAGAQAAVIGRDARPRVSARKAWEGAICGGHRQLLAMGRERDAALTWVRRGLTTEERGCRRQRGGREESDSKSGETHYYL